MDINTVYENLVLIKIMTSCFLFYMLIAYLLNYIKYNKMTVVVCEIQ